VSELTQEVRPEVSVILCTHNRAQLLQRVLRQFSEQVFPDGPVAWELILVNNNSTDDTEAVACEWLRQRDYPRRYLREPRQGKAYALNTGIAEARGEYLLFTDDDVSLDPGWISAMYRAAKTYPHRCIGGRVKPVFDGPLPDWISPDRRYAVDGGPLVREDWGDAVRDYKDPAMYVPKGCNMMIHRSLFERYGVFNTKLGTPSDGVLISGEDSELLFRFKEAGEGILYYPDALVYHPVPSHRLKKSYFRKWWWSLGRGHARWGDIPQDCIRYGNVPRYLIRGLIVEGLRWCAACVSPRPYKRFYYEMKLVFRLGTIWELYSSGE
jgi:glycosyltransferase involved in cell wall biosynthesis